MGIVFGNGAITAKKCARGIGLGGAAKALGGQYLFNSNLKTLLAQLGGNRIVPHDK